LLSCAYDQGLGAEIESQRCPENLKLQKIQPNSKLKSTVYVHSKLFYTDTQEEETFFVE
jgi:hypothetical protein